jgi:hypothetical protein
MRDIRSILQKSISPIQPSNHSEEYPHRFRTTEADSMLFRSKAAVG